MAIHDHLVGVSDQVNRPDHHASQRVGGANGFGAVGPAPALQNAPRMRRSCLLFLILAACHHGDEVDPTLTITSPERGALSGQETITVTGTAGDDGGAVRVTVDGLAADVAADGSFALTFAVPPGIEVVETIAEDAAGNQARDVRAVLAGPLAPTADTVDEAFATRIGPDALTVMAGVVATTVEHLDLAALIGGDGPLLDVGGSCVGAEVHLLEVAIGDVAMTMAPIDGAIATAVTVADLEIKLRADYRVSCNDSHVAPITIRASAVSVGGQLGLAVTGGDLASSIAGLDIDLAGLDLDVAGLPADVMDLLEGAIENLAPQIMEAMMTETMPAIVDSLLADMTAAGWKVPVLDRDVQIDVAPRAVAIDASGALIALDAGLHVEGDADGRFLSTPAPAAAALAADTPGLAVAISDDVVNQAFAGLWAAGALDLDLPLERGDPLGLLVGADTRRISLAMSLPPTATVVDGTLRLAIGDLIVRCEDEAGAEMTTIAVSFATTMGARVAPNGAIELELGEPEVHSQVLSQSDRLDLAITGENVEDLLLALYDVIGPRANQALSALPIPALGGVEMVDPVVAAGAGFVVVRTDVRGAGASAP